MFQIDDQDRIRIGFLGIKQLSLRLSKGFKESQALYLPEGANFGYVENLDSQVDEIDIGISLGIKSQINIFTVLIILIVLSQLLMFNLGLWSLLVLSSLIIQLLLLIQIKIQIGMYFYITLFYISNQIHIKTQGFSHDVLQHTYLYPSNTRKHNIRI